MKNDNNQDPDSILEFEGLETRTTASQSHSKPPRQRCRQPVAGRTRNGYCSDRCRVRDVRDLDRRRRLDLLDAINIAVEQLRLEVLR